MKPEPLFTLTDLGICLNYKRENLLDWYNEGHFAASYVCHDTPLFTTSDLRTAIDWCQNIISQQTAALGERPTQSIAIRRASYWKPENIAAREKILSLIEKK